MKSSLAETKLHLLDYWQIVRNRWGVILLCFLLVSLAALIVLNLLEKKYLGRIKLRINPDPGSVIFDQQRTEMLDDRGLETEFRAVTSPELLRRVAEERNLARLWNFGTDSYAAAERLEKMLEPNIDRGTRLITLEVYAPKPQEAADLANAIGDSYMRMREEELNRAAEKRSITLATEIDGQQRRVDEKRGRMLQVMRQYNIVETGPILEWPGANGAENLERRGIETVASDISKAENELALWEGKMQMLEKLPPEQVLEQSAEIGLKNATLEELVPRLLAARLEFEGLINQGLGQAHPRIRSVFAQISRMESAMQQAVNGLKSSLASRVEIARAAVKNLKRLQLEKEDDLIKAKPQFAEYQTAKHEYRQEQELLNQMRETLMKRKVNDVMPVTPANWHEKAHPASEPARPNVTLLLALGATLGLMLGTVVAFFLEYLDTSVKTLEDVESYLGLPVLAVVPKDVGVLHKQAGVSPDAEAYRILRTNIEFTRKSADANAITIVSGGAGEGKSTTLINLAFICAQGGYNTLVIDADLRRPRLHSYFDVGNSVGLTNLLTTSLDLEDVILQTPVENLYFMPSGVLPADAAGILNSRRMSEMIQAVKSRFDLVLIDSPPILGVSDASVLASEADLTIIVVQHRKLPRPMLQRVKLAIENVGGHLLGVVLNNVDISSDAQYQYYTSYYTYYAPSVQGKGKVRSRQPEAKSSLDSASRPAVKGNEDF